jgi:hypothetical protein
MRPSHTSCWPLLVLACAACSTTDEVLEARARLEQGLALLGIEVVDSPR